MARTNCFWKKYARECTPPVLLRLKRALFGWRWFRGSYATWEEAQAHATGYDEPGILEKVLHATLEVKKGHAAYERDSVLFHEPACDTELLACLFQAAAENRGQLNVLDFGGSLGSTYWQHRRVFSRLSALRWDVVEQPHFVTAGRQHLQDDTLRFFPTIDEAERDAPHHILLASCVVHYLPSPHAFLDELVRRGLPMIVLHNLPLHDDEPDHVRIEHVPPEIYAATYPFWFLNRQRFLTHFLDRYIVERAYPSSAVWWVGWKTYPSTGLLLRRKLESATL